MNKKTVNYNEEQIIKKVTVGVIIGIVALVILMAIFNSFTIINAGEVGIKTRLGKIIDTEMSEGVNFKIPFIDKVEKVSIKVNKVEVMGNAASKDLQDINTIVAVNYRVKSEAAPNLYRTVGTSYEEIILIPAVTESIKAGLSEYTAEDLIIKRSEVSERIVTILQSKIDSYGLVVDNVNIINFEFSPEFNRAIEEKQVAEQEVLKAQQVLERTKVEAEARKVQAQSEAEANRLLQQTLTKDVLIQQFIERWDGKLPTTYAGEDILSMFNLN